MGAMLLYAKKSFKKMYPVAKNYFGGFIQAHLFSCYVLTFAFLDHVEMKGRSKPLTHPECRSTRSKQQREPTARLNSVLDAPLVVARPKGPAAPTSQKCSSYWSWANNGATKQDCRASGVGATDPFCHAIVCPSPESTCECGRQCCECCRGDDELRKFPANRISAAGSNCEYVRKLKSDKNYCETVYLFLIQILQYEILYSIFLELEIFYTMNI